MALILGYFAIYFNPVEVNFDDNTYGNIVLMIIGDLGSCYAIIIGIQMVCEKLSLKLLQFLGKHTILIMGFDYLSGNVSQLVLGCVGSDNWLTRFILKEMLLTLGICVWKICVNRIKNDKLRKILSY